MNAIEFWLSEIALYAKVFLTSLNVTRECAKLRWNVAKPHTSVTDLCFTLESMIARDMLAVERVLPNDCDNALVPLVTAETLMGYINDAVTQGVGEYLYGLSGKGGSLWEREVTVEWEAYIGQCADDEGMTLWAKELSALHHAMRRGEWPIDRTAITEIRPWHATYWKTFDVGYQATLTYDRLAEQPSGCSQVSLPQAPSWYTRPLHICKGS